MARFLNPYNFVRPLPKPTSEPSTREGQLLWRCTPPPHDRYSGLSGEIECILEAAIPIFVSDPEYSENGGHKTHHFFNVGGQDVIPSSSLRGSIRSVFEIVTNSCFGVFESKRLSFRENANNARGLIPAILLHDHVNNRWIAKLLTGNRNKDNSLYAAWVPQYRRNNGNVSLNGVQHGHECHAILQLKEYQRGRLKFTYWEVSEIHPSEGALRQLQEGEIKAQGVLCITNQNINRKHDERFFFTTADLDTYLVSDDNRYLVPENVILRYNESLQETRDFHADAISERGATAAQVVRNGRDSEYAFSRHLLDSWDQVVISPKNPLFTTEGFHYPIYVRINDGKIDYIAPVAIPRVPEARSLEEVLKEEGFDHLLPATSWKELSPADRLFGWVNPKGDEAKDLRTPVAYAGRVQFSHAHVIDHDGKVLKKPSQLLESLTLSILSAPKPTTTRFYIDPQDGIPTSINTGLHNGEERPSDQNLRYGRRGNMLRGRKVYRHHGNSFNLTESKAHPPNNRSDQNRTIVGAHPPQTRYSFKISFENLEKVELGALLWTLQLIDDSSNAQGYHRIGYGKPLGFGSVKITIKSLSIRNNRQRYLSTLTEESTYFEASDHIPNLTSQFRTHFVKLYDQHADANRFYELQNIMDLMILLSEPSTNISIHYPRTNPIRDPQGKNFEWFVANNRHAKLLLPYPQDDDEGFPYIPR